MNTHDYYVSICRNRHNCVYEVLKQTWRSIKYSSKIYSLVHVVQTLLYKRNLIISDTKSTLFNLLIKVLKSVAFFTYLSTSVKLSLCFCNWLKNGKHDIYTIIIFIFISNFACLFESSARVSEYAIFTYPRSLEGLWDLLEKLHIVKSIPYGRQLIYAVSIGVALVIYKNKKEEMPNSYKSILNAIFGKTL